MTTASPLAPPMNHVFVDFENVHEIDLTLIGAKAVSFTLMVGAKQTKLDTDLVAKLMEYSASVRLVKLNSSGKNALDFVLAYYLGRAALEDPTGYFHIISGDRGFDPLILHLRERHINVHRHESCAELTFSRPGKEIPVSKPIAVKTAAKTAVKKVPAKKAAKKVATKIAAKKAAKEAVAKKGDPIEGWVERVLKDFREHPKARPKTKKALLAKVANLIHKGGDASEVQTVVAQLEKAGKLKFDEKDVLEYIL